MRKKLRNIIMMTAAAAMIFSTTAFGSEAEINVIETEPGTAVYVGRALSDPYCTKLGNEFSNMMETYYPDWEYTVLDSENDPEKEATNYETLLTTLEEGDVVLVTVLSGSDTKPYIQRLLDAGIIVVSINITADGLCAATVANDYDMGYLVGSYIRDNAPEDTKIAMMNGDSGYQLSFDRRDGMMDAISERDDLEIIVEQDCKFDKTTGMETMEDWLQLYGDEIGAVIGGNDGMVLGAIEAYKSSGYSMDGKLFVGIDGLEDACVSIENGEETASVLQDAHAMINLGLELAMRQAAGEDVEQKDYFTDSVVITKENVAQYK